MNGQPNFMSLRQDSNPLPARYKGAALPSELLRHLLNDYPRIYYIYTLMATITHNLHKNNQTI